MKLGYFNYLHQKLFVFLIMKKILFVFLFLPLISFAQIQSGEITYSVTADEKMMEQIANEEESNQIKSYIQKMFENQLKAIPYLVYQLKFNKQESSFSNLKNMNKDNGVNLKTTMRNIGVYGDYYTNIKEKENLHQFDYGSIEVLIKQNVDKLD